MSSLTTPNICPDYTFFTRSHTETDNNLGLNTGISVHWRSQWYFLQAVNWCSIIVISWLCRGRGNKSCPRAQGPLATPLLQRKWKQNIEQCQTVNCQLRWIANLGKAVFAVRTTMLSKYTYILFYSQKELIEAFHKIPTLIKLECAISR